MGCTSKIPAEWRGGGGKEGEGRREKGEGGRKGGEERREKGRGGEEGGREVGGREGGEGGRIGKMEEKRRQAESIRSRSQHLTWEQE